MKKARLSIGILIISALVIGGIFLFKSKTEQKRTPQGVVDTFYSKYLEEPAPFFIGKGYADSELLSESFKSQLDGIIEDSDPEGYDPFICAQDFPEYIETEVRKVEDREASIVAKGYYGESYNEYEIALRKCPDKDRWEIDNIYCESSQSKQNLEGETTNLVIYFANSSRAPEDATECDLVYGTEREVENTGERAELVLKELIKGPTYEESLRGYTSFFGKQTANALNSVNVENGTVYIDFKEEIKLASGANSSCGSEEFQAEIEESLMHNLNNRGLEFEYAINGSTESFDEWMQR